MSTPRHTCLKVEVPTTSSDSQKTEAIFVEGVWFDTHFSLAITNGRDAWLCDASEDDVAERSNQWDQPVAQYIEFAEKHLGFQQPGSVYGFSDAGNGHRRLSWTFDKEGTKLEWRWRCKPSPDSKKTTSEIMDFLMDANIRLSEELVRKNQAFNMLKEEADKCLVQSERMGSVKEDLESAIYAKLLSVLNSKKAKLREFRDQLRTAQEYNVKPQHMEEDESSDGTVPYDTGSDDGEDAETSKAPPPNRGKARCMKRK